MKLVSLAIVGLLLVCMIGTGECRGNYQKLNLEDRMADDRQAEESKLIKKLRNKLKKTREQLDAVVAGKDELARMLGEDELRE